jgi:transposase
VIRAAGQSRPDAAARRARRRRAVMPGLDAARPVSLDEAAAKTNVTRAHGDAPRGRRLEGRAPYRRGQTTTSLGALRSTGFAAPLVAGGATTGEGFLASAERALIPELEPGDVAVMGNLSCHARRAARQARQGAGVRGEYQPPYSPDLDPIGLAFSKLERLLRKAAERTVGGLWEAIGRLLDQFGPGECANYFRRRGYAPTRS